MDRELNNRYTFSVTEDQQYILINKDAGSKRPKYRFEVQIHLIKDFFENKPPLVIIYDEKRELDFESIIFGPDNYIFFSQIKDSHAKYWTLKNLIYLRVDYRSILSGSDTVFIDFTEWDSQSNGKELEATPIVNFQTPDKKYRCIIGYKDFVLTDRFVSGIIYANIDKSKTILIEIDTFKVRTTVNVLLTINKDLGHIGYDKDYNIYRMHSWGGSKFGQLDVPIKFKDEKDCILSVTHNQIIVCGYIRDDRQCYIFVYDKVRHHLVNQI